MYQDVVMAGFGGQGVMLIGNLLAQAGMEKGLNATYIPVYGAEMRGGTANCTVVLSDGAIGSPMVKSPLATIILNLPSLDKFQPRLHEQGVQVVNASLIEHDAVDVSKNTVYIPVNDIAAKLGNPRLINMVALGALLKATGCLSVKEVSASLEHVISGHYKHLIPKNTEAIQAGYDFAG